MDDFSRYTWLFFLTIKGQALSQFVSFHKMITNQLNTPIKCLQSDIGGVGGGCSILFDLTLKIKVLYIDSLVLIPPQQNGCVERKIHHVVETKLALFAQASLPSKFSMQAFHTATYLINLLPSKVLLNQSATQLPFPTALYFKQTFL